MVGLFALSSVLILPTSNAESAPDYEEFVYAVANEQPLRALVSRPAGHTELESRPAIVIAHGGGWTIGEPEWGLGVAQEFVSMGLVAVSIQYRLSGEGTDSTPLDAMADACAAIRWVRANAKDLGIAPDRIAAYGWSAGAHLLVSTAIFQIPEGGDKTSCVPDAIILSSPAVAISESAWVEKILDGRARAADISPDLHVRSSMPPTLLLQGRTDTVTPLAGTQQFHAAMLAAGNSSQLIVYDDVGHLFTPSSEPDDGWPNPDPVVRAASFAAAKAFLREQDFLSEQ